MDTEIDPEEGEIVDYEPLVRPSVTSTVANNSIRSSARTFSSDSSESSDSDSDNVSSKKWKPKKKKDSGRNSKYNVWASEFQTCELMDEISGWETGLKNRVMDKSRSVESYYTYQEEEEEEKEEEQESPKHSDRGAMRKRRFGEVVDLRSKLGQRESKQTNDSKSHPRYLSEIRVTTDDTIEDITQDITLKLCEEKEDLVLRVVTVLGKEKAIDMFNRTRDTEKDGGMMVMNGSRRRTPGGVFLQLIKKDEEISRDQRNKIFINDQKTGNKTRKSRSKLKPKKDSQLCTSMQIDSNEEQNLPLLLERKDLALSSVELENNEEPVTPNTSKATETGEEHSDPRQLAVYDDIFDDNPCDIEFT